MTWKLTGKDVTLDGIMLCDISENGDSKEYVATVYDEKNAFDILVAKEILDNIQNDSFVLLPSMVSLDLWRIADAARNAALKVDPNDQIGALCDALQAVLDFGKGVSKTTVEIMTNEISK